MASREPPKKEEKGKGVPMKEALDARVTELSTSLQEMMADGETSGQESSANETPLMTRQTDPSRSAPTDGLRRRESYCLLVRVVKDAVGLSEWDVWLPAHAWNEDIAVDIHNFYVSLFTSHGLKSYLPSEIHISIKFWVVLDLI